MRLISVVVINIVFDFRPRPMRPPHNNRQTINMMKNQNLIRNEEKNIRTRLGNQNFYSKSTLYKNYKNCSNKKKKTAIIIIENVSN